jgi:hypothetical protein
MTGDAAGNRDPMTTLQINATQKTSIRVSCVSGGRPNRAVGLFCSRTMLPSIGAYFTFFGWGRIGLRSTKLRRGNPLHD